MQIISICGCGLSQNKPFFDGTHKSHFKQEAMTFDLPPERQAKTYCSSGFLYTGL